MEGSTLVTLRAKSFVKGDSFPEYELTVQLNMQFNYAEKLKNSRFGSDEFVEQISDKFDETTKKTFRGVSDVCLVAFGSIAEKDPDHGIRSGKLKLTGYLTLFHCLRILPSSCAILQGRSCIFLRTIGRCHSFKYIASGQGG